LTGRKSGSLFMEGMQGSKRAAAGRLHREA